MEIHEAFHALSHLPVGQQGAKDLADRQVLEGGRAAAGGKAGPASSQRLSAIPALNCPSVEVLLFRVILIGLSSSYLNMEALSCFWCQTTPSWMFCACLPECESFAGVQCREVRCGRWVPRGASFTVQYTFLCRFPKRLCEDLPPLGVHGNASFSNLLHGVF